MTLSLVSRPADERLSPLERIEVLCDPGSVHLLRSDVRSRRMGERARAGDGVVGASGRVDGRQIFTFAQDPSFAGGSLGEAHADTVVNVLRLAGRAGAPVVGFIESAGARMQEGIAALSGYGRIFHQHVALSGRVPQISVVCGASAGGGSYAPALTDFVVMTERASMFLTGPGVVQEVTGEEIDAPGLGGPAVHQRNGVCHLVAPTEVDAAPAGARPAGPSAPERGAGPAALALGGPSRVRARHGRPRRGAQGLRRARRRPLPGGRRPPARDRAALGAQRGLPPGPARRALGGDHRQPAQVPRRRAGLRVGRQGRPLRADVQPVRPAARGARRHAGLHARRPPGARRGHPPRRQARARLLRGHRPQRDGDPAQGLRRRLHRHELQGARRRLRVRLALGPDRRHGRQAGGRDRQPPGDRGGRQPRRRPRRARRRLRARASRSRRRDGRRPRRRGRGALGDAHPHRRRPRAPCPPRSGRRAPAGNIPL